MISARGGWEVGDGEGGVSCALGLHVFILVVENGDLVLVVCMEAWA